MVGLEVPPDVLERRIRERTEAMFAQGVIDEVREAVAGPVSLTAQKTLGLTEIAEQGTDAFEPIVARTRRYAAYQRKWMRRIPGLVVLDGTQAPDELADEIVGLALV
jgi:tRNA dimethylallyltransferase